MINLYRWRDSGDREQRMIAVGRDPLFARCYKVHDGYLSLIKPTLGQIMKFSPYCMETFKEPIQTTVAEIKKKYGPVRELWPGETHRNIHQSSWSWATENLMEPKWSEYTRIGMSHGLELYKHKKEDGKPAYAYWSVEGDWAVAENPIDLNTLVREYELVNRGRGIATGYSSGDEPKMNPETIYRSVAIGKYLFREKAINLPKLVASVMPYRSEEFIPVFFREGGRKVVEGDTIKEVRTKIDKAINSYPKLYREYFAS